MLSQPNATFGKQTSITYLPGLIHVQHSCQEKIGWRKDDTLLISNSACSKCKWKEWAPLTLHSPVYHWNKWSPGCDRVTFPTVWVMLLSWAEGQGESCDSKPLQLQSFLATTVNHSSGRDAETLKLGCIRWPTSPTARQQRTRSQCLGSAYCSRRPKQSKSQEPIEWKSFPHPVMGKWEERGSFALSTLSNPVDRVCPVSVDQSIFLLWSTLFCLEDGGALMLLCICCRMPCAEYPV